MNFKTKLAFIIFIIISFSLIFISHTYDTVEAFGVNDIKDIVNDVKDVSKVMSDIKKGISKIDNGFSGITNTIKNEATTIAEGVGKQVERNATTFAKQVERNATTFAKQVERNALKGINEVKENAMERIKEVTKIARDAQNLAKEAQRGIKDIKTQITSITGKIAKFGTTFISLIKEAIVNPFLSLFKGLKSIFNQIFGIFEEIGDKIISLPHCVLFYVTDSVFNTITAISNAILPTFITNIFGTIYSYVFSPVIKWVLNLFEYYETKQKCYSFNVNKQVTKIKSELMQIGGSFERGFGKFDVKKLL